MPNRQIYSVSFMNGLCTFIIAAESREEAKKFYRIREFPKGVSYWKDLREEIKSKLFDLDRKEGWEIRELGMAYDSTETYIV